jgi:multiple sugar transport system permease protein
VASVAVQAAVVALALVAMAPLLWMVSASFMPTGEATAVPLRWLPSAPTLEHYRTLFTRMALGRQVVNSVIVATLTTVLAVLVNGAAGYAFAKLRFRGRDRLLRLMLLALVVPGQIGMLPLFLLVRALGLVNTLAGVVIPGLASIFGIFLVRQFARGIPDELLEAARIDGANRWQSFWHVTFPQLAPVTVFVTVWQVIGAIQLFDLVYTTTRGGPLDATQTIVYYLWQTAFKSLEFGYASAVAYGLFAVTLIITGGVVLYSRRAKVEAF